MEGEGETTGFEKRVRDTNKMFVSTKRSFGSHMYQAEEVLETFETVELHALGDASTLAVEIADKLVLNGAAKLTTVNTETIELDGWEEGYKDKKAKLYFILTIV